MSSLPHRIVEYAATLPEGAPLCPSALLHLGNRAAVDQALSRWQSCSCPGCGAA